MYLSIWWILCFWKLLLTGDIEMHDQIASSYPGRQKTISLSVCNYYWRKIKDTVYYFIRNYHTFRRANAARDWHHFLLNYLLILTRAWTDLTFDLVTRLPVRHRHNVVLMVINQWIKKNHELPSTTNKNVTTAKVITHTLLNNVCKLYCLILLLTSDQGP